MPNTKIWVLFLTTFFATLSTARADLVNISNTSLYSETEKATACTIVGNSYPLWRGKKILAIMAESTGGDSSDPVLEIESLTTGEKARQDNFNDVWTYQGMQQAIQARIYIEKTLRVPYGANDAALLWSPNPGEAICAFASAKGASTKLKKVSLSITDVTASYIYNFGY